MTSQEFEEFKRLFGVVAEDLRSDIRQVAEGVTLSRERVDALEKEVRQGFTELRSLVEVVGAGIDPRLTILDPGQGHAADRHRHPGTSHEPRHGR